MDNLEEILTALPKNKLGRKADIMIKIRLRRLILLACLKSFFKDFSSEMTWHKVLAAGMAIFLFFVGTSLYAYANDNVLPGDRIYPLKRAVEKVEEVMAPGPAKIKVYEKHSSRRLQEARDLRNMDANPVKKEDVKNEIKTRENINRNIESAIKKQEVIVDKVNKIDDYDKAVKTINKIKKTEKKKAEYLGQIIDSAKIQNDSETVKKAEAAYELMEKREFKHNDKVIKEEIKEERKVEKGNTK